MLQAPPGRYKIIERDRQLVTIDTLTGQELGALAPPPARSPPSNLPGPAPLPAKGDTKDFAASTMPLATAKEEPAAKPATALASSATDWAALVEPSKRDSQGRATITTQRWFDPKGPRRLRLTAGDSKKLEFLQRVAIGTLAFALFLAVLKSFSFALVFVGIGLFLGRKVLPVFLQPMLASAEEVG